MTQRFPATWGQLAQYDHMRSNGFDMGGAYLSAVWSVPANTTTADMADALSFLARRHESLRTAFVEVGPVRYPESNLWQEIRDVANIAVDPIHLDREPTPDELYDLLLSTQPRAVDPVDPLVISADLVTDPTGARAGLVHVSHLALDFAGLLLLEREFAVVLPALMAGRVVDLPPARQPREQAAIEATPALTRANEDTRDYFERVLRQASLRFVATGSSRSEQSHTVVRAMSRSLHRHSRQLAVEHEISLPSVLSTMLAAQFSAVTGDTEVLLRSLLSRNHWHRGASYIAPQNLAALLPFRVDPDVGIGELLRSGRAVATRGYRRADYNPRELDLLQRQAEERAGVEFDGYALFNFMGKRSGWRAISIGNEDAPSAAAVVEEIRIPKNMRFIFACFGSPEDEALDTELSTEQDFLGMDAAEVLAGLERTVRAAATRPDLRVRDLFAAAR